MNDFLRHQVYQNLNLKETDELVDIWQLNNRQEYTDTAFEVIEEILRSRQVEPPQQNEPPKTEISDKIYYPFIAVEQRTELEKIQHRNTVVVVYGPFLIAGLPLFAAILNIPIGSGSFWIIWMMFWMIMGSLALIIRKEIPRFGGLPSIKGRWVIFQGWLGLISLGIALIVFLIATIFNL